MKEIIIHTWSDENGVLYRKGKKGKRYFIDSIGSAWEPDAGKVYRDFVSKEEYENYDPDEQGILIFTETGG